MSGAEVITTSCDGHVVVALCGELDVTGAAEAEAAIAALVARGQYLVIDMSALVFLDCAALGALRRVRGLARRGQHHITAAAPQPLVRRLLALTGSHEVFCIQASVAAAIAGIARRRRRYSWRRLAVRTSGPGRAAPSRTGTG